MIEKQIGKRTQSLRKEKGYTQEKFAELIGCSTNHLSAIERGASFPRIDRLVTIINTLGCSADEIFIDVINHGYSVKTSKLAEELSELSEEDQKRIFTVVDALINESKNK